MTTNRSNRACCSRRNPVRRWLIGRKLRRLQLDNSQMETIDELITSARQAGKHRSCINSVLRQHAAELLTDAGFDHDRAVELIRSAAADDVERQTELAAAFGEIYQGLDQRQRQQLKAMWQERRRIRPRCCH